MPNIDELTIQFKGKGIGTVVNNINKLADAVDNLSNKSRGLDGGNFTAIAGALTQLKGAIPNGTQVKNLNNLADAIRNLNDATAGSSITNFAQDMATVSASLGNVNDAPVKKVKKAVESLGEEAKKAAENVSEVNKESGSGKQQSKVDLDSGALDDAISKFKEMYGELQKSTNITSKFKKILADLKIVVPTNKMKALQAETEKTRKKYEELRASMLKSLEAGDADTSSKAWESKERQLDALRNKYDELILKQKQLAQEGGAFQANPNFGKAYQGIQTAVGGVKQAFGGVSSAIQTTNKYIDTFFGKLLQLGSASKKAKKDTVALTDSFKKFAKEVTRLSKMLKLMITRMALRAVIKEVGNGFKSLALHSQEFDQNMSNLINSSKTLGYSFAGMAGQLLNALAPALLTLIQLITKAINALNQLFSALRGGTTWNKAKDFTGSWSDSIKAANKNAKELKKTVLGFDELNQLQDKKTSGGDTSGNIVDMFEDAPIDPIFKDWAEKIKNWAKKLFEPIKNAWAKVGDWVKAKWKYAWDELKKLGASVARDFWKVWEQPETEQIFKNILIIVGEIGRTIGNLARQFRIAWDENKTGLRILEGIRDIILIITNHLRNMATYTADWAASLDFRPLLTAIADWLESLKPAMDAIMGTLEDFYRIVVLRFSKWVIESGLPELINVFKRFNDAVHWDELREKLRKLWEHLEPFMETVGEGLIIFIDRLATGLKDFVNSEKFEDFLVKFEEWLDKIEPEDVADALEKLAKALIAFKIAGLALSALSTISPILMALLTVFKGLAAIASGVGTFASAVGGLGTALLPIAGIAAAVTVALISLVKSYGSVEEAVKKIKSTIDTVVNNIKQQAEKLNFKEKIDKLKQSFSDLGDSLGKLKGLWDALFWVIEKGSEYFSKYVLPYIGEALDYIADVTEATAGLVEVVGGLFDVIVGFFEGDADRVQQGADNLWDGLNKTYDGGVKGLGKLLTGFNSEHDKTFENIADVSKKKIGETKEHYGGWAAKVTETKATISSSLGELTTDIGTNFDTVKKDTQDLQDTMSSAFSEDNWTFKGVADGLRKTFGDAKTAIKDSWNAIADKVNGEHEIGEKKIKINLPKIYAQGGFPEDGLFFANHNELVGSFSNGKTAVANNAQIVTGIERGVYSAVSSALQNNSSGSSYISNEILVDGEVIARTITKAQEKQNRRYAPSMG